MRVQFTSEMKKVVTVAEMPAVRKVIEYMKEDEWTAKDYAESAAQIASGCNTVKVLEASAEIAGNCRINDWYDNGSSKFDVWVEYTAVINSGFGGIIMGGAYVTDICSLTGDNAEEIRSHMYIRKFTEVK